MDTGKNKMVGMRKKRALRGTLFAVILSASMSFSALAAMTADGPGMGTAAGASADTSDSTDSEQVLKTEAAPEEGPIRMDVVYGYDNVAKSGRFLPLDIQLDNTSEETFEGTLCVTSQEPDYDGYSNNSQEKYDTYRYEFPVMIQPQKLSAGSCAAKTSAGSSGMPALFSMTCYSQRHTDPADGFIATYHCCEKFFSRSMDIPGTAPCSRDQAGASMCF